MRTIYVVTDGEYSDYHICGVFTSKANAKLFCAAFGGEIEKHEANPCVSELRHGCEGWFIRMARDGEILCASIAIDGCDVVDAPSFRRDRIGSMIAHVMAISRKHAVKQANDARVQMIARGEW